MATDFGTDIRALPDLSFETISGLNNLKHALFRRLITPRGGLFYDPDYGTDLRRYLNVAYGAKNTSENIGFEIEQVAANECRKDPRVKSADAVLTFGNLGQRKFTLTITIVTALGAFPLVISADDLAAGTVQLAELE